MTRYSYKNIERRVVSKAEKDPLETIFLAGGGVATAYGIFTQNQSVTSVGAVALVAYGLYKYLS